MDAQAIIERFKSFDWTFPREDLEAAIAARDQITPHLLQILEHAVKHAYELAEQEMYMGHICAMYLLAQFREQRAYPLIVEFFSLPGDLSLDQPAMSSQKALGASWLRSLVVRQA